MPVFNRRNFLKASMGTVSFPMYSELFANEIRTKDESPHFFLVFHLPGGLDATYTFDARPLEMTKAGLQHNYLNSEPTPIEGSNGQKSLMSECVKDLVPYLDYFSVLNGVVMEPAADAHGENQAYFLTGDTFGGTSIFQHLSEQTNQLMNVAKISPGFFEGESRIKTAAAIDASPRAVKLLADQYQLAMASQANSEFAHSMRKLMNLQRFKTGGFNAAHQLLQNGYQKGPDLTKKLGTLHTEESGESGIVGDLSAIFQFFKGGLATCGFYKFDTDFGQDVSFDVHFNELAKLLPDGIKKISAELAKTIKYLRDTAYDDQNSLLDVTTVVIASEFSRTMRQLDRPIDDTGTDHNPLTNSLLIGGKGIKGGLILGESDFATPNEVLSQAHLKFDEKKGKIMGRPFDYQNGFSSGNKPDDYLKTDYLSIQAVMNTVYECFGAPKELYRKIDRDGNSWPIIQQLLKS